MERGDRAFKIAKAHRISVVEYQKKLYLCSPIKSHRTFWCNGVPSSSHGDAELHKKMQRKAHDADEPQQP